MSRTRRRQTTLRAPYLRRVWLDRARVEDWEVYPFCLPLFRDEFDHRFDAAVTIIVGENGTGKSRAGARAASDHQGRVRTLAMAKYVDSLMPDIPERDP